MPGRPMTEEQKRKKRERERERQNGTPVIHLIPKWPEIYADTNWPLLPRSR